MDASKIGYWIGRYTTRVVIYATKAQLAIHGYHFVDRVAKVHKINSSDPKVVSENLFSCLEYIDW